METIDYYDHWNKARENQKLYYREKESLRIISSLLKENGKFIDLGCGNGYFLQHLKKRGGNAELRGLDYSKREVEEAKKKGFDVVQCNFEEGFPENGNAYDVVYAAEIIEHLFNPDIFLAESNRILRKGGYLLLTTPNLLAWFNRILAVGGIQPLFLEPSTKSKLVGAGPLKKMKADPTPVGHVRVFTLEALKDLLAMNGFRIVTVKGSIYDSALTGIPLTLDKLMKSFPKLASGFILLAQKTK